MRKLLFPSKVDAAQLLPGFILAPSPTSAFGGASLIFLLGQTNIALATGLTPGDHHRSMQPLACYAPPPPS